MLNYDIFQLHWVPAALTFCPNSSRTTHHCSRPFIATHSIQIGLVLKVCLQKDLWVWFHVAAWSAVNNLLGFWSINQLQFAFHPMQPMQHPLPLNPWTEENSKYPWEDGSFSPRWVHVRVEEDECDRLDLNRQVPPLDKCDLGNDWPTDYQLGRQLLCFWLPWVLRWASFQTLFHIFMVLCTLACCRRCQCTEPREVGGVIAWLHLLQCFLSTSLRADCHGELSKTCPGSLLHLTGARHDAGEEEERRESHFK